MADNDVVYSNLFFPTIAPQGQMLAIERNSLFIDQGGHQLAALRVGWCYRIVTYVCLTILKTRVVLSNSYVCMSHNNKDWSGVIE